MCHFLAPQGAPCAELAAGTWRPGAGRPLGGPGNILAQAMH